MHSSNARTAVAIKERPTSGNNHTLMSEQALTPSGRTFGTLHLSVFMCKKTDSHTGISVSFSPAHLDQPITRFFHFNKNVRDATSHSPEEAGLSPETLDKLTVLEKYCTCDAFDYVCALIASVPSHEYELLTNNCRDYCARVLGHLTSHGEHIKLSRDEIFKFIGNGPFSHTNKAIGAAAGLATTLLGVAFPISAVIGTVAYFAIPDEVKERLESRWDYPLAV